MTQELPFRPEHSRLSITRRHNEIVHIGDDIAIRVTVTNGQPRLLIQSPRDVTILRDELINKEPE